VLPKFRYLKASSVEDAVSLLSEHGEEARIFAGGTDLLIGLEDSTIRARYLIDIKGIPDLCTIKTDSDGTVRIGSCVTVNALLDSQALQSGMEALREAAGVLATYQIRNRATVGGNLCNASPACDLGPPLLVLGAELRIVCEEGERMVPLKDFFSGVKTTCCKPYELVTEVVVPGPRDGASAFRKRQRIRGHDLAIINGAASFGNGGGLKLALGAVAPVPLLVDGLDGIGLDETDKAVEIVSKTILPIDDVRGSRVYREQMACFLTRELLSALGERLNL
jgi:carbon-monoxide dehydrogenase medium subunit